MLVKFPRMRFLIQKLYVYALVRINTIFKVTKHSFFTECTIKILTKVYAFTNLKVNEFHVSCLIKYIPLTKIHKMLKMSSYEIQLQILGVKTK